MWFDGPLSMLKSAWMCVLDEHIIQVIITERMVFMILNLTDNDSAVKPANIGCPAYALCEIENRCVCAHIALQPVVAAIPTKSEGGDVRFM
jgi:hypothetical protein